MATIVPKSTAAKTSFDAIYDAVIAKGGSDMTENVIDTYADGVDSIVTTTINFHYHEKATENGCIDQIYLDLTLPKQLTGIDVVACGKPSVGFLAGFCFGDVELGNNLTNVYRMAGNVSVASSCENLTIRGTGVTFADGCLEYFCCRGVCTIEVAEITGGISLGALAVDGTVLNMPNLTYIRGQVESISGNHGIAGNFSNLAGCRGANIYGVFNGFTFNDYTFPALTHIQDSMFAQCTGVVKFPALVTLNNADFNYNEFVQSNCSFTDVYIGGNLATVSPSQVGGFTNLATMGATVHIPAGASTTKTTLDALSIAYVQDYVV